jgi:hypothetical protein
MRFRCPRSETKATARKTSTTAISQPCPSAKPARSRVNSERKIPKGGSPRRASMPAAKRPPVHGITRRSPDTLAISGVP